MSQNPTRIWRPLPSAFSADTLAELSALLMPNPLPDGALVYVTDPAVNEFFRFSSSSALVVDGSTVLSTSVGGTTRWIKTTIVASGTGGAGIAPSAISPGTAGQTLITRGGVTIWAPGPGAGELSINMANADVALTAEQASRGTFKLTSANTALRSLKLPIPATQDDSYMRTFDCRNVTGGFGTQIELSDASGTKVTISDGLCQILWVTPSGIFDPVTGI